MKQHTTIIRTFAVALALATLAFSQTIALADERPNRDDKQYQLVSFTESFSSFNGQNGTLDGNVVLAGKLNDKGTRHEQFSVISASRDGSLVVINGTSIITTPNGTITTQFTGTIHFTSAEFAYVEGPEYITGGTGAYANERGKGSFVATQDGAGTPYQIVGTLEVKLEH